MKIDFVSAVVCPWCAVGLSSLELALERIGADDVASRFQPFELNPQMPPGGADIVDYMRQKYGLTPDQVAANADAMRRRGAAVGFVFGERTRTYNSFDAHRLLHWAGLEGGQRALKHALLRAYFTDGDDVGDPAVLVRAAETAGLDGERARAIVDSDRYADEVRSVERFYVDQGIQAVPSVIVDDRHLVQGGQPVEEFERILRAFG